MKAAYIGYDQNGLASLNFLSKYFEQVDFYLINPEQKVRSFDLDQIPLLVQSASIPAESRLRTELHQVKLKALQKELLFFKSQLSNYVAKSTSDMNRLAPDLNNTKSHFQIYPVTQIKDVAFNAKTHEVHIELDKTGVQTYQYLLIEEHQVVSDQIKVFSETIFKKSPQNSHVWFSLFFEYELKKPRNGELKPNSFIFVKDEHVKSVLDNWYFCNIKSGYELSVQQWVPTHQFKNSDFQKFMADRAEKLIREKIDLIQINRLIGSSVNASAGFLTQKSSLKNSKLSSVISNLNFLSEEQIQFHLTTKLGQQIKDVQKFFLQTQNTQRQTL